MLRNINNFCSPLFQLIEFGATHGALITTDHMKAQQPRTSTSVFFICMMAREQPPDQALSMLQSSCFCPCLVSSLKHTCALCLDMPQLSGGWILLAQDSYTLTDFNKSLLRI